MEMWISVFSCWKAVSCFSVPFSSLESCHLCNSKACLLLYKGWRYRPGFFEHTKTEPLPQQAGPAQSWAMTHGCCVKVIPVLSQEPWPSCSSARGLSQTFFTWKARILLLGYHLWKKVKSKKNPVALALWMMGREQWENPRETSTFFSLSLLLFFAVEWNKDRRKLKIMNRWEKEGRCFHWAAASHKCVLSGKAKGPFQVIPAVNLTSVSYFSIYIFFLLKIYLVSF